MWKEKTLLLWDLDGTLTDPMEGITRSVQAALRAFGIDEPDRRRLCPFIGPPLLDSFREFYGFSEEEAARAVVKYREYFAETGIFENTLYPGVPHVLETLAARGKTHVLATSKPTVFAERILTHFGLSGFFTQTIGSNLDGTRTAKAEVVAHALAQFPDTDASAAVMIGDRHFDMEGAHAAGIDAVGVTYGYGSREELEASGAAALAASPEELLALLL